MTEDRPGYDGDLRMCLIRPGDCKFSPADSEAELTFDTTKAVPPDAAAYAVAPGLEEWLAR